MGSAWMGGGGQGLGFGSYGLGVDGGVLGLRIWVIWGIES